MKYLIIIFSLILSHNIFSQTENHKTFDYKTPNGKVVVIEIDTSKYIPNRYEGFLNNLQNKKIDASIFINEKVINMSDTIMQFKRARKEGEFTDLGTIDGEKTFTMKTIRDNKDKRYVYFSYMKIIPNNELLNCTVVIPEINFEKFKKEFLNFAKTMKLKL